MKRIWIMAASTVLLALAAALHLDAGADTTALPYTDHYRTCMVDDTYDQVAIPCYVDSVNGSDANNGLSEPRASLSMRLTAKFPTTHLSTAPVPRGGWGVMGPATAALPRFLRPRGGTIENVQVHHKFSYNSCGFFEVAAYFGDRGKGLFRNSTFHNNVIVDSAWILSHRMEEEETSLHLPHLLMENADAFMSAMVADPKSQFAVSP